MLADNEILYRDTRFIHTKIDKNIIQITTNCVKNDSVSIGLSYLPGSEKYKLTHKGLIKEYSDDLQKLTFNAYDLLLQDSSTYPEVRWFRYREEKHNKEIRFIITRRDQHHFTIELLGLKGITFYGQTALIKREYPFYDALLLTSFPDGLSEKTCYTNMDDLVEDACKLLIAKKKNLTRARNNNIDNFFENRTTKY